jgi:yecA family protein
LPAQSGKRLVLLMAKPLRFRALIKSPSADFAFKITLTVKTLPVNFGDFALALEDQGGELHVYYFDTQTGAVLNLSEDFNQAELHEIREEGFGRFVQIEPMNPREGYRIMADFVADLPSSRVREKLEWSLDGPKPFRRFKAAVREDEAIRKRWFDFHNARIRELAIEWLADHQIRPEGLDLEDPRFQKSISNKSVTQGISEDAGKDEESDQLERPPANGEKELSEPLSDEEEAELVKFLESFPEEPLSLAKLHGLFTALAVGPGQVVSQELMADLGIACGKLPIQDSEGAKRISAFLSRFYSEIIQDLASGSFVPHLQPKDVVITDILSDMASWCQGFILGMEQDSSAWRSWFKDPRREKLTSLITRTAAIHKKSSADNAELTGWRAHSVISDLVPLIASYWRFESELNHLVHQSRTWRTSGARTGINRYRTQSRA